MCLSGIIIIVSIILDFTMEAPISPLKASTAENPPIPSKYLQI